MELHQELNQINFHSHIQAADANQLRAIALELYDLLEESRSQVADLKAALQVENVLVDLLQSQNRNQRRSCTPRIVWRSLPPRGGFSVSHDRAGQVVTIAHLTSIAQTLSDGKLAKLLEYAIALQQNKGVKK